MANSNTQGRANRKGSKPPIPWGAIRNAYVLGEAAPGSGGHAWPTKSELADRNGLRLDVLSRKSLRSGPDGRTWDQAREALRSDFQKGLLDRMASNLADQEMCFRATTFTLATQLLREAAWKLDGPQTPDSLLKLTSALKRIQEIGLIALRVPQSQQTAGSSSSEDDWTLMRKARQGFEGRVPPINTKSG